MAIGAMRAVQERGFIIGKDIAVTGFDDTTMAEHSHPPLTTVNQPVYQIGQMVTEILIQSIREGAQDFKQTLLKPSLVIRESCGC
jgi:LacI family transcriptional regulator